MIAYFLSLISDGPLHVYTHQELNQTESPDMNLPNDSSMTGPPRVLGLSFLILKGLSRCKGSRKSVKEIQGVSLCQALSTASL